MNASGLTTAFLVAGLSAWRLLKAPSDRAALLTARTGLVIAAVLAPLQVGLGDLHGLNTLEHQPAKIAAIEALWETRSEAPLVLFAIPDEDARQNRYSIEIPRAGSIVLRHHPEGVVQGLKEFGQDIPPVTPVFFAFRIMVVTALLMVAVAWAGSWATRNGRMPSRRLLWIMAGMTFSGWVATICGWLVTEMAVSRGWCREFSYVSTPSATCRRTTWAQPLWATCSSTPSCWLPSSSFSHTLRPTEPSPVPHRLPGYRIEILTFHSS